MALNYDVSLSAPSKSLLGLSVSPIIVQLLLPPWYLNLVASLLKAKNNDFKEQKKKAERGGRTHSLEMAIRVSRSTDCWDE